MPSTVHMSFSKEQEEKDSRAKMEYGGDDPPTIRKELTFNSSGNAPELQADFKLDSDKHSSTGDGIDTPQVSLLPEKAS